MNIETTPQLYNETYKIARKLRDEGRHEEAGIIEQCSLRLSNVWSDNNDLRKAVGLTQVR